MASYPEQLADRLYYLPLRKRREAKLVVKILFEEFQKAQSTKSSKTLSNSRILKLTLFGSYARGDWAEDKINGCFSDYNLRLMVSCKKFTKHI